MLSLEYCIVYCNCIFGFLCCIGGFLDEGITGGFGVSFSTIGFVLTLVYTIYNGYILYHDSPSYIEYNDLIKMSTKTLILFNTPIEPITYAHPKNELIKTDSNGIYANYNKSLKNLKKCQLKFPPKINGDTYESYAKYKDLGLSVYNFDNTLYIKKKYDNYNCIYTDLQSIASGKVKEVFYKDDNGNLQLCDNLYYYELSNASFISYNKYLYDRWITAFSLGIIIIILYVIFFIVSVAVCDF